VASDGQERKSRLGVLTLWVVGVLLLLLAGFVWLWWHWIPVLYDGYNGVTQAERLTAIANTRAALFAALIGLGALLTAALTIRAQRFTAETLHVSQQTFKITERGHLTDRYAKAIEQLGGDKLDGASEASTRWSNSRPTPNGHRIRQRLLRY
jgi:hypothetical protein